MEIKYLSGEIIVYECSKCGARFYDTDVTNFNFCPNCRNLKEDKEELEDKEKMPKQGERGDRK